MRGATVFFGSKTRVLCVLVLAALTSPAFANLPPDCTKDCSVVGNLGRAVQEIGELVLPAPELPPGRQELDDLLSVVRGMSVRGENISSFFEALADGQERSIDGDSMRALMEQYWMQLDFLPIENLVEMRVKDNVIYFTFDFGKKDSKSVKMPTLRFYAMTPDGPRLIEQDGKTLKVKKNFEIRMQDGRLAGVEDGDLEVKYGPFWPNLNLRTEKRTMVALDEEGRPILKSDGRGLLLENGEPVPATYEDWNVISAKGREIWIPLRPIRPQQIHVASLSH